MAERYEFTFEKLRVWEKSGECVRDIFETVKTFPMEEKFGSSNQLTRAADSVAAKIAEGEDRTSPNDQAHFSQFAYSSLMETGHLLLLAGDQGWMNVNRPAQFRQRMEALFNRINALRKAQLARSQ